MLGATFDEALYEAIMVARGDGENQHEIDPPAPQLEARVTPSTFSDKMRWKVEDDPNDRVNSVGFLHHFR